MAEDKKKSLFGWVREALGGKPTPQPQNRSTGTLRSPGTDSLFGDSFQRASHPLKGPRPQAASTTPLKKGLEQEEAESKKRMAFIMSYLKNPQGDPAFQDRTLVFRILTEERSYQQKRIQELQIKHRLLPRDEDGSESPERSAILKAIESAQTRQAQIYSIMKKLTGVKGKTGGTGLLPLPPDFDK